ncbi:MAG TPA: hydroxyisourate hydrolase [Naasia sp.]|jgi:5-hydroxyisourate hydrolase
MSQITTSVLDAALGRPAAGVTVALQWLTPDGWTAVGKGETDGTGRAGELGPATVEPGVYRLTFATGDYFAANGRDSFYPEVTIVFQVTGPDPLHVPLLLSPFGYSTHRDG